MTPTPGSWLAGLLGSPVAPLPPPVATTVPPAAPAPSTVSPAPFMTAGIVASFEGFSAKVYPDPASGGVPWTQGYGSTRDENGKPFSPSSPPMSRERALALLTRDIAATARVVDKLNASLPDVCKAACISLGYNVGSALVPATSTLARLLVKGDLFGAADRFPDWNRANGKVNTGLVNRRAAERKLFLSGLTVH